MLPMVTPLLRSNGGPVIMIQIENEFGMYGDVSENPLDMKYLMHLVVSLTSLSCRGAILSHHRACSHLRGIIALACDLSCDLSCDL